jgi:signal transduction histidine kinase/ActR/RegA family two-component response regulator
VAVSDLDGNLLHFNRCALELHHFENMEECRRNVKTLDDTLELSGMDGKVWTVDQWPLSRILRGETVRNLEVNVRGVKKRWHSVFNYGGVLVRDGNGKPIMGIVTMSDITERKVGEQKVMEQMSRLALLNQITRSTSERLDLHSIFQVVVGTLEDQLPASFCCICLHDPGMKTLTVTSVGAHSLALSSALGLEKDQQIAADESGLARCSNGALVYEPDTAQSPHPFSRRMAGAGLRAFVASPLIVDSKAFGILIAARRAAESFSSGECEFLRQLSEHVALAAHQAQLHTALQLAYDELRQTQQTAMQQERLRALGQMASGIAHDINNAISPVALYTESLLETEPNLSPRARDCLQTIQRSIDDVAQTVARMREFYRQRETQLTLVPVQLNPLIQQVIDLSRARWNDMPQQRGFFIEVRTELDPNLPVVSGVESEIREALLNLVFNAVDAMPEGGKLTVRTRTMRRLEGSENGAPKFAAVEVIDNGMGMDEDTRRRCVEPFFTTKGERGTGLGLAMVYGIIQRHAGDIEIDSEKGRGTTMRLVFPAQAAPHAATPAEPAPVPHTRMRILIVDDDPLLIKSLRDTLEMDGHLVVAADGGESGIATFRAALGRNGSFNVVITDLGMPYVDGRKVAAAVKEMSPVTPVILLTGWGQRLVAEGDVPPHVDQVLNKPPKLRDLREALAGCELQRAK